MLPTNYEDKYLFSCLAIYTAAFFVFNPLTHCVPFPLLPDATLCQALVSKIEA